MCGNSSLTHAPDWPCCCELEHRRRDREPLLAGGHRRDPLAHADRIGQVLVEHVGHVRLVVEHVQLRGGARHEQVDDPLGLGGKMRLAEHAVVLGIGGRVGAPNSAGFNVDANAAVPIPVAVRPKKCRRVCSRCGSNRLFMVIPRCIRWFPRRSRGLIGRLLFTTEARRARSKNYEILNKFQCSKFKIDFGHWNFVF